MMEGDTRISVKLDAYVLCRLWQRRGRGQSSPQDFAASVDQHDTGKSKLTEAEKYGDPVSLVCSVVPRMAQDTSSA